MRLLYGLALYVAAALVSALYLVRGLRDRSYLRRFGERFGLGEPRPPQGVWVHAVSVGEVQACAGLVRALARSHPQLPLTVTTFTPTGAARARALFGDAADVRYLPYDLPGAVRRFLDRVQPRLAVIFETELWPNLYRECRRRRVPLVIASARLSARSVGRYRRLGALFRETLASATVVASQGEADAERFRSLGADPAALRVTGNVKFDLELPPDVATRGAALRRQYARGRPMWVAGSVHPGEVEAAIEAHAVVRAGYPGAFLVIAPRHPARFGEAAEALARAGLAFVRRSTEAAGDAGAAATAAAAGPEVLLLDTLGELLDFYAAADVAFVGGSLVPVGGHNLLEPAALGVPVLTGPHTQNAPDIARLLIARGAAAVVADGAALGTAVAGLLADETARARMGEAGRDAVAGNRGALAKLLALIEPLLG